ncbi:molybdopterin converting factor subunit 1 [Thermosynechococcaceae cyanobacterium Okahandja]
MPNIPSTKTIRLRYFALLREQAGTAAEQRPTTARTYAELYGELQACYGFSLPLGQMKVAVNDTFVELSAPVQEGDDVVFIPPVAGG